MSNFCKKFMHYLQRNLAKTTYKSYNNIIGRVIITYLNMEGVCTMYDVLDVCKYVISYYNKQGRTITNLKLQKILYYLQGYVLKETQDVLFHEEIHSWTYGPVSPKAYYEYCSYVGNPILENYDNDEFQLLMKNKRIIKVIDKVLNATLNLTARELVSKTHEEAPWLNTQNQQTIHESKVENYFLNNDPLNIYNKSNNCGEN